MTLTRVTLSTVATAALIALLLGGAAGARPEADPLAGLERAAEKLLADFEKASEDERAFAPNDRNPIGASAVLNRRWFHGASEARYTVVFFPTDEALNRWLELRQRTRSALVVYWDADRSGRLVPRPPFVFRRDGSVRTGTLPKETRQAAVRWSSVPRDDTPFPLNLIANRVVICVSGGNHSEAKRRDPEMWRRRLADRELGRRLRLLAQRFVRLAMEHGSKGAEV